MSKKEIAIFENELNEESGVILTNQGLMKVRNEELFKKITKVNKRKTLSTKLTEMENDSALIKGEGFYVLRKLPKIPYEVFLNIITFFQDIVTCNNGSEVFVQVYWNKTTEEYELICPNQEVGGAHVNYQHHDYKEDDNMIWALDIHSHNTMGAFFSSTDNGDEKQPVFYGVCGRIGELDENIQYLFRVVIYGKSYSIDLSDVFELPKVTESVTLGETTLTTSKEKVIITSLKHPKHEEWVERIKGSSGNRRVGFLGKGDNYKPIDEYLIERNEEDEPEDEFDDDREEDEPEDEKDLYFDDNVKY